MPNFDLVLKNGRVVSPANKLDEITDVAIKGNKIIKIECNIDLHKTNKMIDVSGKVVIPGIIDPHVHIKNSGHRNMAKVGVVTAVDVAAPIEDVLQSTIEYGSGMNIADITNMHVAIHKPNPSKVELNHMVDSYLDSGSLGVKIVQEPFPHETIIDAIGVANERKVYVKLDCGVTEEGSNIDGLKWIVDALGNNLHLDIAHVNSYCRGQIKDPVEEALDAINMLKKHKNIQSESYLGIINGTSGKIVNDAPLNGCTRDCLRLGGYAETKDGMIKALKEGYCKVPEEMGGETILLEGEKALRIWLEDDDRTVSFPVNVPSAAIFLVTKKFDNKFVINAISTDGGSIPRNLIVNSGLGLVKYGALTLNEFILKTSYNPSRMFGMIQKGSLDVGLDADITILDLVKGKASMGIALGKVIMVNSVVMGQGGTIITTKKGAAKIEGAGLPYSLIDVAQSGLYT